MPKSILIAVGIVAVLLLFTVLAFKMKKTENMRKLHILKKVEVCSVVLFGFFGLASLLIFNHCITVWLSMDEIKRNMNIHQLENMLPEYENYANQRIENYKVQLDEAIRYKKMKQSELVNLGFNINSGEALEIQKTRKIDKLEQILRPHIYKDLTDSINASITKYVDIVEDFSPNAAPKYITQVGEWAKMKEKQLTDFSHEKMSCENAEDFHFESTFGNVENILTNYDDCFSEKRLPGYITGLIALICMLFPYLKVKRSNKLNY
jgi:hypothetical protein